MSGSTVENRRVGSLDAYMLHPIGVVRSELVDRANAPRQGDEGAPDAAIEVVPAVHAGLDGIQEGQELIVLTWLHEATRDVLEVHPRDDVDRPLAGVFGTRSSDRPNPIGLHRVTVRAVDGGRLRVGPLEAIDGTPVVDIKPALRGRANAELRGRAVDMSSESPDRHAEALRALGLEEEDLAAWRESGLTDEAFDDWLTDRLARRPSGSRAPQVYGAEDVHDFARRAILDALRLQPGDELLELGCGGGLLLRDALATGASATGIDHSEEMVELAQRRAPGARVVLGRAESLPFADDEFSRCSNVRGVLLPR